MSFKKSISTLALWIILLSFIVSAYGVFSNHGSGQYEFKSIHGESIQIYGKGLYQYDSVSVASQGKAQDIVTLILGIPLLIVSLHQFRKGNLKGRLLLTGTLGYFLYTYASYSFLWMYNSLFLIYVVLMSASFFAFILSMMSFDIKNFNSNFDEKLPVKFLGGLLIFIAVTVGMMWIGRIVPAILKGTVPLGLEHYTTLTVQALDLGFLVPAAILAAILIIKRKPFGYLLAPTIIIKEITMLTAITAMIIGQALSGVQISIFEIILFPLFNLLVVYCMIVILKNIKESRVSNVNLK